MLVFIQPLFLSTPIGDGGMGLSTPTIGLLLGLGGLYNGLSQALLFPRLHRWLGTKRLFMASVASYIPLYAAWPWMDVLATRSGQFDGRVKTVFILQQFFLPLGRMGFSSCSFSLVQFSCSLLIYFVLRLFTYLPDLCRTLEVVSRNNDGTWADCCFFHPRRRPFACRLAVRDFHQKQHPWRTICLCRPCVLRLRVVIRRKTPPYSHETRQRGGR